MSDFGAIATSYEDVHNRNLRLTGESSEFFVRHKVGVVAEFWRARGLPEDGAFLDLGCGIGRTFQPLRQALPRVRYHGADPSGESIEVARSQAGNPACVTFDGRSLPYADASFDMVFAACVVHHVPPDMRPALYAEVRRVLKPGGYFVIFEHNPLNPATQYLVRTCDFDDDAILLRAGALRRALHDAGLGGAAGGYVLFLPRFLRGRFPSIERRLTWLPLGAQYWIAARRPG
jgi:SAM-dependent methyltransferase